MPPSLKNVVDDFCYVYTHPLCLGIAQSGSASALGAEGREFESLYLDQRIGSSILLADRDLVKAQMHVRVVPAEMLRVRAVNILDSGI